MKKSLWHVAIVGASIALFARPGLADIFVLSGSLDAAQVVDGGGSTSTATGFAMVTIDTTLFTITTDLSWTGLSGPADRAHLHDAPEGVSRNTLGNDNFFHEVLDDASVSSEVPCDPIDNDFVGGGFLTNCAPTTGSTHNVLQLSGPNDGGPTGSGPGFPNFAALVAAFLNDGVYIDMHTELYPDGEIRGQLLAPVPEPSSLAMFGVVLLGLGLRLARRRNVRPDF